MSTRAADAVRALLAAAQRLARDHAGLVEPIARDTGLSPEGVERGFARHLELEVSADDLAALLRAAGEAPCVSVILSANVFTAALRAIALAWAAAPVVRVRPSRRDPTFAHALIAELAHSSVMLAPDLAVDDARRGEIHVYGRDATIAVVRARARVQDGVVVRGHGSGIGVAYVSASADLARAAASLAEDVVAFDQRGCLSPRVALVEGDRARARAFGDALDAALTVEAALVPRGVLDPDERAEARRYADALAFAGDVQVRASHCVGIVDVAAPLVIPPSGRHVHVAAVASPAAARTLVAPFARHLVAVGSDALDAARAIAPPHARLSRLGAMQRPPLDGPVDLRTA